MGPLEVFSNECPKQDTTVCKLLGKANEVTIKLGDCLALIGTGSMVSSFREQFYKDHLKAEHPLLNVKPDVNVEGAGGNQLDFLGVVEVEMRCTEALSQEFLVPTFVMPAALQQAHACHHWYQCFKSGEGGASFDRCT